MTFYRSHLIALLLCVFLGGCKVQVSIQGQGNVDALTSDIPFCTDASVDLCLNASYNQRVELRATPADGYVFAGWAGECSGVDNCVVRALGTRQVVAVFRKPADQPLMPMMRYIEPFFFSGPWPSDIRRNDDGTLDVARFPAGNGRISRQMRTLGEKATGFARNGNILVPLNNKLSEQQAATVLSVDADVSETVQLVNLNPDSPRYLERIPVVIRFHADNTVEQDSLMSVEPAMGHNLAPDSTYGLILIATPDGFQQSDDMQSLIANETGGLLHEHWQQVQRYVADHTFFQSSQVAGFTLFTTQPVNPHYDAIRTFLGEQDYVSAANQIVWEVDPSLQEGEFGYDYNYTCYKHPYSVISLSNVRLPFVLKGTPPFLLSGGGLNYDSEGKLAATNQGTDARILVTLPCVTPSPDVRLPIEFHAFPTGYGIEDLILENRRFDGVFNVDADFNRVIRVMIPAPYTVDRSYDVPDAGLEAVAKLFGATPDELNEVLGAFNPMNLGANEGQHLQYALEILYIERLISAWLEQRVPSELADLLQPDFSNSTLVGQSLAGLAVLHANAIDSRSKNLILENMPRPNAMHMNNSARFLNSFIPGAAYQILENFVGLEFPVAPQAPVSALLQTVLDPIDPVNQISYTRHQNLLLTTAYFFDDLHGRAPSYSIATAFDLQTPLDLMLHGEWNQVSFPIHEYVSAPAHPWGATVEKTPVRVVMPWWDAFRTLVSFTGQMAAGQRFDPNDY